MWMEFIDNLMENGQPLLLPDGGGFVKTTMARF